MKKNASIESRSYMQRKGQINRLQSKNTKWPIMQTVDVTPGRKEEIHFISQDIARKLIVPKPQIREGVINEEKLNQLHRDAMVTTKKEDDAKHKEKAKMLEQLQKESEARRAEFEAWDLKRKKNEQLSEMEEEAKQKMEFMCEKANEIIKEQNEEIKEINQLILSAKVQAIRDAQVIEKQQIRKELKEADANLDEVMERERRKGVLRERELKGKRQEAAQKDAEKLQEQIKANEDRRIIGEEKKFKEGEMLLKKLKEDQMRDIQEYKTEQLKKKKFLEDLTKENEDILKRKQTMKEQSEREDKILAEYQKLKAIQDEAKEAAEKEAKEKRLAELAKLGEMHERASDIQAEQEGIRSRRAQEAKEREYRKREKEEAMKRKRTAEDLKKSRAEQLELQQVMKQKKAEEDIKGLEALLKNIKEETKNKSRKELFKKLDRMHHLEELKKQMRQKEMERMDEKREFYREGLHLQLEEKRRNEMLDVLKREKLEELKKYDVPEAYINHIKRKVHLED